MKLCMDNVARIGHADMSFDGITVVAGANDTGKSTSGKVLYALFNALSNIDQRIERQRADEIEERVNRAIWSHLQDTSVERRDAGFSGKITYRFIGPKRLEDRLVHIMEQNSGSGLRDQIYQAVSDFLPSFDVDTESPASKDKLVDTLSDIVESIAGYPREKLERDVLTAYFSDLFHGQINSLREDRHLADIRLSIKDRAIAARFDKAECASLQRGVDIQHKAVYIDNPFVLDSLGEGGTRLSRMDKHLRSLLKKKPEGMPSNPEDGLGKDFIQRRLVADKLSDVMASLGAVVHGDVRIGGDGTYYLQSEELHGDVVFDNLSTGLKSFVILKMLIEQGQLGPADVLILDEPEIHLHPEWQITYAQLIVLLQKAFDLTVAITTHSPYFLNAIQVFSRKYAREDVTNYYLMEPSGDGYCSALDVTDNLEAVYAKMARPFDDLAHLEEQIDEALA